MKVFVLFLSLCFVLNVVISPTYASEEVCTIKATCRTPSIMKRKWMTFVTPDENAEIESEVSLLKKNDAAMKKEAEKNKEKLDDAMKKIELLNEKVERMEKKANESKAKMDEIFCPVIYENKCFIPVIGRYVNYDGGVKICGNLGGHLANIYSQIHMDDVMKYIRGNRMGGSGGKVFRLGMKYDPKAKKLTLRDGADAPAGLKWLHGYPKTLEANGGGYADWTNMILRDNSDQSSLQYLSNTSPWSTYYVLCEIE